MTITLQEMQDGNLLDDVDWNTVDELRMGSPYLLNLLQIDDIVVPGTNGGALSHTYRQLSATRSATTRQENTEYPAQDAKRIRKTVDLIPMGGRYNIDRVYASVGATSEVDFQQSEVVRATIAKFSDLFINGTSGKDFGDVDPEFEGLDAAVTGTITDYLDGADAFDFSNITTKDQALLASRTLRAWTRKMDGPATAFFVNEDGAAWLDQVGDYLGYYNTVTDGWGNDASRFRNTPYVDLGSKPGSYDQQAIINGTATENPIIETDGDGVTTIYAARLGLDSVHAVGVPGNIFKQWLPNFNDAGAVKPGEVELGPLAPVFKRSRGIGAFRVKVTA